MAGREVSRVERAVAKVPKAERKVGRRAARSRGIPPNRLLLCLLDGIRLQGTGFASVGIMPTSLAPPVLGARDRVPPD